MACVLVVADDRKARSMPGAGTDKWLYEGSCNAESVVL